MTTRNLIFFTVIGFLNQLTEEEEEEFEKAIVGEIDPRKLPFWSRIKGLYFDHHLRPVMHPTTAAVILAIMAKK